jgi:hypothetical protein
VYRSDSLDALMQEERAYFRVDAIWRRTGAIVDDATAGKLCARTHSMQFMW